MALTYTLVYGGCAYVDRDGSTDHVHRFALPAEAAARCFARNAEAHSSALMSEISRRRDGYDVAVRVRNGLPYAAAQITDAGAASRGVIQLNVRSSRGTRELLDALLDGC